MTTFNDLADMLGSDDDDEDDEEYRPSDEESVSEDDEEEEEEVVEDREKNRKRSRPSEEEEVEESGGKKERTETTSGSVCSDNLWSSFLKRSGCQTKKETKPATVERTQIREFAGEKILVTEKVATPKTPPKEEEPKTTWLQDKKNEDESNTVVKAAASSSSEPRTSTTDAPPSRPPIANGATRKGGIGNLLASLNKSKMTVLEKSKMDWSNFVSKEGIQEELQIHNRGKGGYLERMAFLQRTDQRQYEIERDQRMGSRRKQ